MENESVVTYRDIFISALFKLNIPHDLIQDYRPASPMFIPELSKQIDNAIIIWLKDNTKIIYFFKEN